MKQSSPTLPVYLELGAKRVFAGALDWPGWCLSGRDEDAALQALLDATPRYAKILKGTRLGFKAPTDLRALKVVERLQGNAATDFGAANIAPAYDAQPLTAVELKRQQVIFKAVWAAFNAAAEAAAGRTLSKGPRGGGRLLDGILAHVLGAQAGYLASLGWKIKPDEHAPLAAETERLHAAALAGLAASVRGEIPARGSRGGLRWSPRYFVRRSAWHVVDHTWEIEKRVE
jgi:hypothetical protein